MLKKSRSTSTTSTRATSHTTSSVLSYPSSQASSRLGNTSVSVSDNSVFSLEDPLSPGRLSQDTMGIYSYDDVNIIDELYEFFGDNMNCQRLDFGETQFQNKERALRQLLEAEEAYIASLQLLLEHYYKPLIARRQPNPSSGPSPSRNALAASNNSTNAKQMAKMTGFEATADHLTQILKVSTTLHSELKERFSIWGPTQLISDIMHRHITNLSVYTTYLEHFPATMATVERLTRNPATKKLLEASTEPSGTKIPAMHTLLAEPLSALSRYSETMSDLMRFTDPFHPDARQLKECVFRITQLESNNASLIHACQEIVRVMEISCSVRNCPLLLDEPRRFIMRGNLTSVSPGSYGLRDDRRTYFLLSDMLLVTRPREDVENPPLVYKGQIDLIGATIKEVPKKRFGHMFCFEVVTDTTDPTYKYADDVNALLAASGAPPTQNYFLRAGSKEAYTIWIQEISNAIQQLRRPRR